MDARPVVIRTLSLFLLLTLFGCQKADKAIMRPGDDPLADRYYESFLIEAGIQYVKNPDGFYVSDLSNRDEMRRFATKAYESINSTTEIELESACISAELSSDLDKRGAIYVIKEAEGKSKLRISTDTYEEFDIWTIIHTAENACAESEYLHELLGET